MFIKPDGLKNKALPSLKVLPPISNLKKEKNYKNEYWNFLKSDPLDSKLLFERACW